LSESVRMLAAASARRDALELLLRARKLDRTLTSNRLTAPDGTLAPVGVTAVDGSLGGGLARGHMSEIVGPRSSGRTTLLHIALAAAARRDEAVALVDTLDMFDVVSADRAGVDVERLLWVRGPSITSMSGPMLAAAVDRALKAFNLILQAGGFGLVVLDLAEVPIAALRRLPFTTWLRLQRVLEGRDTVALLIADDSVARSTRGVTLRVSTTTASAAPSRWQAPPFVVHTTVVRAHANTDPHAIDDLPRIEAHAHQHARRLSAEN